MEVNAHTPDNVGWNDFDQCYRSSVPFSNALKGFVRLFEGALTGDMYFDCVRQTGLWEVALPMMLTFQVLTVREGPVAHPCIVRACPERGRGSERAHGKRNA